MNRAHAEILFWPARLDFPAGENPSCLAVADLDGNEPVDLAAVGLGSSGIAVLLGEGDAGSAAPELYGADNGPYSVAIGDLNGDEAPDLAVSNPAFTRFSFPPRWHHDILRTLDYFRASGAAYDERLEDPIAVLLKKQTKAGKRTLQNRHAGKTFFEMERLGGASRWNTLRALRLLDWWDRTGRNR